MWPWGHAAVGFLLLSVLTLAAARRWPRRAETLVVLFATQLPDLIDKPLAWTLSVLPTGRSLAHSLLTAIVFLVLVSLLATRYDQRELTPAFGIGYVSHLLTDLPIDTILRGDILHALWHGSFLLWPILPSRVHTTETSIIRYFMTIEFTIPFLVEAFSALLVGILIIRSLRKGPTLE